MSDQEKDGIDFSFGDMIEQLESTRENKKAAIDEIEEIYNAVENVEDNSQNGENQDVIDLSFLKKEEQGLSLDSSDEISLEDGISFESNGVEKSKIETTITEDKSGDDLLKKAIEASDDDIDDICFSRKEKLKSESRREKKFVPKQNIKKEPPGPWICTCGKHNKYMYCSICGLYWEKGILEKHAPDNSK